jgi:hypothetical protein
VKTLEKRHGYGVVDNDTGRTKRLCEWPETAERIADYPYELVAPRELWYDPEEGRYYGPIEVVSPDRVDKEARRHNEAKAALQQKLRDAGFDVDEVRKTLMI